MRWCCGGGHVYLHCEAGLETQDQTLIGPLLRVFKPLGKSPKREEANESVFNCNCTTISIIAKCFPVFSNVNNCVMFFRELQNNGKHFTIQDATFKNTPLLTKLRIEGNPNIRSLRFLKSLNNLREVSADSWNTCQRCDYTRIPKSKRCGTPGNCLDREESPFGESYCACALCTRLSIEMNCTGGIVVPPRIMGEKTTVRVVLWVISTLALVSNLALTLACAYTHVRRRKQLGVFIVGLALSNLFVTSSVMILLVADSHQSPRDNTSALGRGNWSQSVCSPVYFLKHFGIYSLVIILTFIILERFTKLGYKFCFAPELSFRRSVVYICEAWVLSFLLIIPPWTRVTAWHKFCIPSYEMAFAKAMYLICGLLVLAACFLALMKVGLLLWRRVLPSKSGTRCTETRTDIRLILAGVLTFVLLGLPHGAISISQASGGASGAEIVTILLSIACLLYPLIFLNYSPREVCLSDTLSTKDMECTCGKCNVEQFYPTEYSSDSLNPPKFSDTTTECTEDYHNRQRLMKVSNVQHTSDDSLLELDTWTSRSTKTKSWIESCDYEDIRKLRALPWPQTSRRDNSFREVTRKPRALTWSDRYGAKSTSTSGVNDVSSVTSSCSDRVSSSSGRAQSSSERERSSSDHTSSVVTSQYGVPTTAHERGTNGHPVQIRGQEIVSSIDSESEKTSERKRRSKRLSSFMGLIQRAFSPKRQRSKSLPEKPEVFLKKVERSQSAPFTQVLLDKTAPFNNDGHTSGTSPESAEPTASCQHHKTAEHTYRDRLASFFVLAPAKSPKHPRKPTLSPGKAKPVGVVSPTPSQKSSVAERLVKSISIGRKSPMHEPASPGKTIALEAGDILTDLPVMRRQKLKAKPRDPNARISTGSNGSTGSTATRFSLEWDPIGSVEGYDENEVLPPYPPLSTKIQNGQAKAKVSKFLTGVQPPEQGKATERTSLYSLDWDPTSVQMRNIVVSRDSLGPLGDTSDDEDDTYDIEDCKETTGKTVWV